MSVLRCSTCGHELSIGDDPSGRIVACPRCRQEIGIPAPVLVPCGAPADLSPPPDARDGVPAARADSPVDGAESETLPPSPTADYDAPPSAGRSPVAGPARELIAKLAPPEGPDELGRLGSYRILSLLGAGGMGVVFRAEDLALKRIVALKAIQPALAVSDSARERFMREARAAAAVEDDHIVHIYQVGEDRGIPYLAMQFLKGESLQARLKRQHRLPAPEVLRIGREIAQGLAAAHARGLVHRDIKPANIWLEALPTHADPTARDRVKILDFGLVRSLDADVNLTQSGVIIGTAGYMAPEQMMGKASDHRADLFSLGCVIYRMATGEQPFRAADPVVALFAVSTEQPRPPRQLNPSLPAELDDLVMRLLAKDPAGRPASATAVVETIRGIEGKTASSTAGSWVAEGSRLIGHVISQLSRTGWKEAVRSKLGGGRAESVSPGGPQAPPSARPQLPRIGPPPVWRGKPPKVSRSRWKKVLLILAALYVCSRIFSCATTGDRKNADVPGPRIPAAAKQAAESYLKSRHYSNVSIASEKTAGPAQVIVEGTAASGGKEHGFRVRVEIKKGKWTVDRLDEMEDHGEADSD